MWKKINNYYMENNGWTIPKLGPPDSLDYALWHGNVLIGWFKTSKEAKAKYDEIKKAEIV